jgi:hypothetical protein
MSDVIGGSISGGSSTIGGSIGEYVGTTPTTPVRDNYAQTVGDGVTTVFAITHNLGTLDTMSQAYNPITGANILPTAYTAVHTSANVTTVTFLVAPAAGAARVIIDS